MSHSDYFYLKKILVIQTASIGDVILATPVIEKLHFHFPDAQIDFLVKSEFESVVSNNPYISNIITFNSRDGLSGWKNL